MNGSEQRVREKQKGANQRRTSHRTPRNTTGAAKNIAMDGHATGIDGDLRRSEGMKLDGAE